MKGEGREEEEREKRERKEGLCQNFGSISSCVDCRIHKGARTLLLLENGPVDAEIRPRNRATSQNVFQKCMG